MPIPFQVCKLAAWAVSYVYLRGAVDVHYLFGQCKMPVPFLVCKLAAWSYVYLHGAVDVAAD